MYQLDRIKSLNSRISVKLKNIDLKGLCVSLQYQCIIAGHIFIQIDSLTSRPSLLAYLKSNFTI